MLSSDVTVRYRHLIALIAAIAAGGLSSASALAATGSPYSGSGYDASSYQCGSTPPAGASFAILRVTGGRAFTTDSCFAQLWNAAPPARSIYFNTGYSGSFRQKITPACTSLAQASGEIGKYEQAYAIGCSEAAWAFSQAPGTPSAWWADVETGNSWSSSDLNLNMAAIRGILDRLAQTGQPYGIYSTRSAWQAITGGANVSVPDWVVGSDPYACGGNGFSGGADWLIQGSTVNATGVTYDWNQAC